MKRLSPVLLVALSVLTACTWWMAGRPGDPPPARLAFNHELHYEFDLACWECHTEPDEEAPEAWQPALPGEDAVCLDCHDRERECTNCHPDPAAAAPRLQSTSDLGFEHGPHFERVEGDCTRCHQAATDSPVLPLPTPDMDTCLECHNHEEDYDEARCMGCHPTMQQIPIEAIAEFEHSGEWMERHSVAATTSGTACLQCHSQSQCTECHSPVAPAVNWRLFPEDVGRPLLHRGDWLTSHPIDARATPDSCLRCHETSTCSDCHVAYEVSTSLIDPVTVHPPGWLTPGAPDSHGPQARLYITTCAGCHDQGAASNCVECHQVGAAGGNPHPASFSDRYDDDDALEDPMCQTCHF